jgi:DNA-binding response OmpR family regulator
VFQILLVEDAADCQVLVKETLFQSAKVRVAASLKEARNALKNEKFDLILLDLSLPDGDGMEFFSEIQSKKISSEIPVIFLTSKGESAVQVTAFSLGADDYVVKPIRPMEFRARVEARLKKVTRTQLNETTVIRGDLRIELSSQQAFIEVTGSKRDLALTGREFKLIYHLARYEGTIFSRDQLISAVWGDSVHVMDRTVDTHVYTLRKKLGVHAHYIESEVGLGYRLNSARKASRMEAA